MVKLRLAVFIFLTILAVTLSTEDEAELYYDEFDYPLEYPKPESNGRSAKLSSTIQSPIIDFMLQSASVHYVPETATDFFDFLRDSYPLPGGLSAPYQEYDFIIVGAGSAGCVLAARLTENKDTTVLLIEAGKPEMILTDVPALAPYFQSTEYSWPYYMEPQEGVCTGMENGRCYWPRGKAVGGTSVINYMIYTRGRPQDWDRIAADGNYGWSYNDILKYYIKSEKASLKGYEKSPYRGTDGELPVEFPPKRTKLVNAFLEAGILLGHPTVDYNAPDMLGFGVVQATLQNGKRQSAAKAFLHKHKKRHNLHILPETRVTRILIEPNSKTAYGVEYVRNKVKYTARARKEVILSAGPIASPQLLMLSGVGPRQNLNFVGIPVIQDLPVGQRLYDHICFPGIIFELNVTGISFAENRVMQLQTIFNWLQYGDNFISTLGGVEGIGYIKTYVSDDPEPVPDIELINLGGSILSDAGPGSSQAIRKGMRITDETFHQTFASASYTTRDVETWSIFPMLLHPKSFGRIELRDSNPFSNPIMIGNYLTNPKDVATFIASIRYIQRIAATEPFQKYGAKLIRPDFPNCRGYVFDSDEFWECGLRTLTATLHHQIATTRMGPPGDPLAVVDPELRVYGVNNLRVVDSGVIPRTISAHTNAPAIAIGEKAADMIKSAWRLGKEAKESLQRFLNVKGNY